MDRDRDSKLRVSHYDEQYFTAQMPVGEFGNTIDRPVWGASFYVAHLLGGTAVSLGARLSYVRYGSEYGEARSGYDPDASGSLTYRHDLLIPHLVVRVQPRPARLTPYLETGIGIHYFVTRAYSGSGSGSVPVIVGDAVMLIPDDRSRTLHSSVAPSIGVGGGVKLRLFRLGKHDPGARAPMSLCIDVQGRYVLGGTADYLVSGGIGVDGQEPIRDFRRSRTDLVFFGLGLSITR